MSAKRGTGTVVEAMHIVLKGMTDAELYSEYERLASLAATAHTLWRARFVPPDPEIPPVAEVNRRLKNLRLYEKTLKKLLQAAIANEYRLNEQRRHDDENAPRQGRGAE